MTRIVKFKVLSKGATTTGKKTPVPTEGQDQIKLIVWIEKQGIPVFAIPNGGKRNLWEAMNLKRSGVRSGVPDLFIPVANKTFPGLFIELKRASGGVVSDAQLLWLKILRKNGFACEICRGLEEAKKVITDYLANTDKAA